MYLIQIEIDVTTTIPAGPQAHHILGQQLAHNLKNGNKIHDPDQSDASETTASPYDPVKPKIELPESNQNKLDDGK